MKIQYFKDTDTLYLDISEKASVESQEISPGIVLDFDEKGSVVGIELENASKIANLSRLETESIPVKNLVLA